MKLLVFAHVPPPHHGQSYMVKLMLDGFGGDRRKSDAAKSPHDIDCYHVDVRLSKQLEDIGEMRVGKFILLLFYCLQAIWFRFRYGVTNFYYVPTPGKTSALYRDWLVMMLCRPFFKRVILHWHAAGLAKWLETCTQIRTRSFTYQRMKDIDLSIVLTGYNRSDAEKFFAKKIAVVNNGIPDPCSDFEQNILPRRKARLEARRRLLAGEILGEKTAHAAGNDPHLFKVLFLGHCTRQKGLFDTLDGVAIANQRLNETSSPLRIHLTVAGQLTNAKEQLEFKESIERPHLKSLVSYVGFVAGCEKARVFEENDCFCFPTYYYAESFGLVIIESMAFGMPVLTTSWRSLPEILPPDHRALVDVRSPRQVAEGLLALMTEDGVVLRDYFLKKFTLDNYLRGLAGAIHGIEHEDARPVPVPLPTT